MIKLLEMFIHLTPEEEKLLRSRFESTTEIKCFLAQQIRMIVSSECQDIESKMKQNQKKETA